MDTYFMVAIIYFAMSFTSNRLIAWVKRALTPAHRRAGAQRASTNIDALPIP
jgi:hypothetical protein